MAITPVFFIGLICFVGGGFIFPATEAIWLTIPSSGEKCVFEELRDNVVVIAEYICVDEANNGLGPTLDVRVTSPFGKELYKKTNETYGQFAFTTTESGTYAACLSMHHDQTHYTSNNYSAVFALDWRIGIRAKDWDSIAKKEKIDGVELELRKSAEMVAAIKLNIVYLKFREASMRGINDNTNKMVQLLGLMSLGVSVVVSLFQVWHLRRFFIKKKLI